jgi:hypothetical protein
MECFLVITDIIHVWQSLWCYHRRNSCAEKFVTPSCRLFSVRWNYVATIKIPTMRYSFSVIIEVTTERNGKVTLWKKLQRNKNFVAIVEVTMTSYSLCCCLRGNFSELQAKVFSYKFLLQVNHFCVIKVTIVR